MGEWLLSSGNRKHAKLCSEQIMFWISLIMVISLVQLPFEEVNGVRVPTMFKDKVSLFYALVLSLNFSFFSSVSIFGLRQKYQRTARCCLAVALGSSAAGIVIFTLLVLPAILNLLYVGWFDHFLPVR